jgi:23S rRNA pseudouridine2605 synthase
MSETRLQKYLAEAGVASRRKSEELIQKGRVKVNGATVTELGTKVTGGDVVMVDGKEIKPEENKVYIMLNKPAGYVTTSKDQFGRKTVLDLIEGVSERIYPVGRLDYETTGILLFTNDGELAYSLTHPAHDVQKIYRARIDGHLNDEEIKSLEKGVRIDDYITSPAKAKVIEKQEKFSEVEIIINEGRNRQVRKMFEAVGYIVLKLKRISIGSLTLGGLEEGKWRHLDTKEVKALQNIGEIGVDK